MPELPVPDGIIVCSPVSTAEVTVGKGCKLCSCSVDSSTVVMVYVNSSDSHI